ncbi:hypothetical protein HOLleu_02606 [Holothuria leucospilota]|uniref:Uncharacterized protein n=1 Tax=Holothuria leucospilota TaxID=206669 RepID=A0A9Q1CSM8_HOLLE|nr:hypothetical protein HOLleu_02606 [Holothuria leucospilota]
MVKWWEHQTCSRKVWGSTSGRVISKASKMEPTAVVVGAQHKQWSRENKPVSHNCKKGCGLPDLNQLVRN